jgi:hypothetical protein
LKKRTKKLLLLRALALALPRPAGAKVFLLLFFQKKKRFLPITTMRAINNITTKPRRPSVT